ncbi:hypothetical protein HHK36_001556 [Tetracentron sinense]|uniref:DUF1365 domain-containing protein n=1 Tax=Tetracentron sinense TaxID=13715 RepID=A0A834ZXG2_TETSI|nr:hypothetical protein HHK36_001556 [Tetracentron sinense]
MEAFYLLCSIVSTFVKSSVLSILLLIKRRQRSTRPVASSALNDTEEAILYQGTVWHERRRPVHHSFRYAVRYALIDLDGAPDSLPNHLSAHEARRITKTTGPVFLLTIPPSVGYEQNPLSVYYCYDLEGSTQHLKKCIAEVTNTPWGERVSFVFNPNSDLVAKPLHVSPFMDMLGNWSMRANEPGDDLFIAISVQHPNLGDYFTATLRAKRVSSSSSWESDPAFFFWLMPQKVALWIYWQALKLWWKNVNFIGHPKCINPTYREEALIRNRKLQCCQTIGKDKSRHLEVDGSDSNFVAGGNSEDHWCVWRDAQWPWS